MATLVKTTHVYATHDIPLECDVFEASHYPRRAPVFLFFHSGGLVGGSRRCIPPWLVQTCFRQQWPIISASYRLLPQVDGQGLLADATAAYEFARNWGDGPTKEVIVGGASAGCSLAFFIAHNLNPRPLAIVSITGIPTFRHPFFNSSTLLTPEPLNRDDVQEFLIEPVSVGWVPEDRTSIFHLESLLPSGAKNPRFVRPAPPCDPAAMARANSRGMLYEYFVHRNCFTSMVGAVDRGFEWARENGNSARLSSWPMTVFIQGDDDLDVDIDVCRDVAALLGDRARFCLAKGQAHLFEAENFIEDDDPGMSAVREAIGFLERVIRTMA